MDIQIKENKIFAPLKDKWLVNKPEEQVRQRYICRLVDSYGYSLDQMSQEMLFSRSKSGQGVARADIVVWRTKEDKNANKCPLIVVECKADSVTIHQEDYYQGYNYAAWAGADFFVTTNLKETRVFSVRKGSSPKKIEEIAEIPSEEKAKSQKEIEKLLNQTKAFTREEFSKLLFKCHNIIRNNDKLSPEAAFDEISKVLFIKICYERRNEDAQIFSYSQYVANREEYDAQNRLNGVITPIQYYQYLFEKTKQNFVKDQLFEPNDIIKIRENSFGQIVKELQIYNLSTTSDDVKGIAYEKVLGRTFRGELGQFFTPRTIVDFMVKVLDPQEGECICDPCCGSGGFLIDAFEYVRSKIEADIEKQKEQVKQQFYTENYEKASDAEKEAIELHMADIFSQLNQELDINNINGRLRALSFDCIYGTDANPRMARTAKMNMIMHGDGHGGVHHHDGLLNVNGIFDNRFDVILTNPPFGAHISRDQKITKADQFTDEAKIKEYIKRYGKQYLEALRQVNDHIDKSLLSLYETGSMSGLTEVLFIERCLNLLKPGGRMGIVLPEGVLNTSSLQKVRDFVESKAKILLIVSIPQDVFIASGATVKPSLLFFKKFTEEEAEQYKTIVSAAQSEAEKPYEKELREIAKKLAKRGKEAASKEKKKELQTRQKFILATIEAEAKKLVKERFDYPIPISEVQKAGISTTGAPIENELIPLEKEFTSYRKENHLWESIIKQVHYYVDDNGNVKRVLDTKEEQPQ